MLTVWMDKRMAWLAVASSRCESSPKPHGSGYPVDSWQATGLMQSVLQLSGFFDLQRASALCANASQYGACKSRTYASNVGCTCWQIDRHQTPGRACEVQSL